MSEEQEQQRSKSYCELNHVSRASPTLPVWTGAEQGRRLLVPVEALAGIVQEAFTEAGWPCECWQDTTVPVNDGVDIWENAIEPDEISPCPTCNGLEAWWDGTGAQRCLHCDPPTVARRLASKAVRLRRRADRRQRRT